MSKLPESGRGYVPKDNERAWFSLIRKVWKSNPHCLFGCRIIPEPLTCPNPLLANLSISEASRRTFEITDGPVVVIWRLTLMVLQQFWPCYIHVRVPVVCPMKMWINYMLNRDRALPTTRKWSSQSKRITKICYFFKSLRAGIWQGSLFSGGSGDLQIRSINAPSFLRGYLVMRRVLLASFEEILYKEAFAKSSLTDELPHMQQHFCFWDFFGVRYWGIIGPTVIDWLGFHI